VTTLAPPPGIRLPSLRQDRQQLLVVAAAARDDGAADRSSPPRRPVTAEILTEVSLVALVLSAALGIARLMQSGLGHSMILPLVTTILAGSAVTATAARRNFNLAAVAALGLLAVALVTMWTVVPSATRFGIPTATTVRDVVNEIQTARAVMGSHRTPIPLVPGIVLIVTILSGAVAVVARTLWEFRRRSIWRWPRLVALVPTLAMFCYAAPLSARIDRPQITILYLSSALVFVAASDSAGASLRPVGPLRRARAMLATILPTLATAGTALLVLLLAAAALSGTTPLPFPWWSSQAALGGYTVPGQKGSGVTSLSLVADLRAAEVSDPEVQMFVAQSPVPTYWQVGILDVFNGSSWVAASLETAALNGQTPTVSPATPTLPAQFDEFTAKITVDKYSGRLLPAPPLAQEVSSNDSNLESATIDDGLGVSIDSPVGPGDTYAITAALTTVPPASSNPTFASIDAGLGATASEYLHLPNGIPVQVVYDTRAAVAGAKTPLQDVQALVNYFRGGTFNYTLDPPAVPPNQNPLVFFLDNSREGYCQQFAAAFGVMARELHIPVRLAVGFTSGHLLGRTGDTYAIDGSDAHVWPEVYLGPSIGWLSVDPTPGGPEIADGTKVPSVLDARPLTGGGQFPTGPKKGGGKNRVTTPKPPKDQGATAPTTALALVKHGPPLPAGTIFGGVVAAVVVVGAVLLFRRSRRSARPRSGGRLSGDPDSVVIRSWMRAADALGRAGFRRSLWTTPAAHAHEIRDAVTGASAEAGRRADATAALGTATFGYIELAELAELACYSPGHCSSRDARHAEQEAWRIERALRSAGLFRRFPSQYRPSGPAPA
jgi:transglutaminase-like putative cysteine protease